MDTSEIIEKIEKLKLIYRILILVGLIVLMGGLYVWQVHVPKTKSIAQLKTQNVALSKKIDEAKQKSQNLAKFEDDMAQVQNQYKEALTLLPKKEEIPNLLRNITELGAACNLDFKSFSPSTGAAKGMYTEISASISISGRYHDILLFFDRVGKMKRIVNIKGVSFSPQGNGMAGVSCRAVTYKFNK